MLTMGFAAAALLLLPIPSRSAVRIQDVESLLQKADRFYAEKTFGAAADTYEGALAAGAIPADRRDEVEYRIAVALGRAKRWDRALDESLAFVRRHRGTVWEARGLYGLGRLYLAVPNQGWKVGKRFFRGKDAPAGTFEDKPEFQVVFEQDLRNARDALEAARVLYPPYRSLGPGVAQEEIQLDFDLARVLRADDNLRRWARRRDWTLPADPAWQVDPAAPYSTAWPPPRKLLFLYQSAAHVAGQDRHQAALALLGEALWLRQYHMLMRGYAVRWKEGKPQPIPYPYQDLAPIDTLREILRDPRYDDESVRDIARVMLASDLADDNRSTEGVREVEALLRERPQSPWAVDARRHLDFARRRALSIGTPDAVHLPGVPVHIQVAYRSVDHIRFQVFRLRLENIYERNLFGIRDSAFWNLHSVWSLLGAKGRAGENGPPLASWEMTPAVTGDFEPHQQAVTLPVTAAGAYLVEASADGVSAVNIVVISDLALVQKSHRDGTLFFAADARTGAPVPGVKIIAIQSWRASRGDHLAQSTGTTGADGLVTVPYTRNVLREYVDVQALAYTGDRYALTDRSWLSASQEETQALRAYGLTDRAVYRPGQRAHYRLVLMRSAGGHLRPAAGAPVQVVIRDPQGNVVGKHGAQCGAFGTVHDDLAVRLQAPLGEYTAYVIAGRAHGEIFAFQYRVEEYKKPEFQVTVHPEPERVLLGEPATARVTARYYFGGPVPNARVKYWVFREETWRGYHFPRAYDFLYYSGNYSYPRWRSRLPVEQGEARTDAQGAATITFPTRESSQDRFSNYDAEYKVEAEVQDASRRVIAGSGTVQAVRRGLAVYLGPRRGYVHLGEAVEVDVAGVDPSNRPRPASGLVTVVSAPEGPREKTKEILRQPLQTDLQGKALFAWRPARAGYYRVTFLTHDARSQDVKGSADVWVDGPDLAAGGYRCRSVVLAMEKPFYTEGQTARALLVTPAFGCTVLLTREAGNLLLEQRLVRVPGRSLELDLPIGRRDSPDVYLSALLVRDGEMHHTQTWIRVPPVNQLASVAVQTDRTRYQPGETAALHLTARDSLGRPLRAELSLAVSDASLDYIQDPYARDIREDFYGRRGGSWLWPASSLGFRFDERVDDTQPRPSYPDGASWNLPAGMGLLPDWPGVEDESLHSYIGSPYLRNGDIVRPYSYYWDPDQPWGMGGGMGGAAYEQNYDAGIGKSLNVLGSAVRPTGAGAKGEMAGGQEQDAMNAVRVRRLFLDTALWAPAVVTDARGNATVRVTWPDNLTRWRAHAVGVGGDGEVGNADAYLETKKNLLVRLSAPRFCVERDSVTLSANVHNALPHPARVRVRLELGGDAAELAKDDRPGNAAGSSASVPRRGAAGAGPLPITMQPAARRSESTVDVPAGGERRLDWTVRAQRAGLLPVRVIARSEEGADAMEVSLPVLIHGAERVVTRAGILRDQNRVELAVDAPHERAVEDAELVVHLQPSLAIVALEALPYLIHYPYGCVEQTMSRFLPAVVVAKTLNDLGYDLEALRRRRPLPPLNPPEPRVRRLPDSPYTYSAAPRKATPVEGQSLLGAHEGSPVFDPARLKAVVEAGLKRIREMRHSDGGWGWWKEDPTDPTMTAYVVYGLLMARNAGYAIDEQLLHGGLGYLQSALAGEKDLPRMAFEARVLAMEPSTHDWARPVATGRLFDQHEKLSVYSKALLVLTLHDLGRAQQAAIVLRNIEDEARIDESAGTVRWDEADEWWRWYNDPVETHAVVLQAYLAVQPNSRIIPMLVRWLVQERARVYWGSTRETAMAVLALAEYMRATRELAPDYTITVAYGGRTRRTYRVTRDNALTFDGRLALTGAALRAGDRLTITKRGAGALYYTVYSRAFSQEEPLQAVAGDIAVERRYFRLIATAPDSLSAAQEGAKGRPNPFLTGRYELLAEEDDSDPGPVGSPLYRRVALAEGDSVASGDLIEVELQLESKHDFDHLVFEDIKPAGCEPVELHSGEQWEPGVYANREMRDQKVAFFIDQLPEGRRLLTYRLYAEAPGRFHVLPTSGYAMYAPALRALSRETLLRITEPGGSDR